MKTSSLSISMARAGAERSFLQKLLFACLIMAVLFSFLPAAYASAAPASDGSIPTPKELKGEWNDKLQNLRDEGFFYERVRVYPADFKDRDELARAHELLNTYGAAYRTAQTLIFNHTGFDANGLVINDVQANQSIKGVAEQLRIMRAMRNKLEGLEGMYRLLPTSAVTTTSS